jgi:hypothetical protein
MRCEAGADLLPALLMRTPGTENGHVVRVRIQSFHGLGIACDEVARCRLSLLHRLVEVICCPS